ncbi:hypothetical protein V6N11_079995 [Hibiscus sabdariffa]|uniref:Uncharacterized protein n=1 Tax=Hibiscus sabdariffa TaxID=183260 RepID=A0ABR2RX01_9ROSI
MTLEETAKEYLTRLINRSLVQVEWSDSTGRARSCRAHDLIHEVLLSKLEELNLIQSSQANSNGGARYLWIDNNRACDLRRRNGNCQTHSIIFFNLQELHANMFERLSINFKLLRELDFENAPLEYIPEEIGNLWHLRYLSLRNSKVRMLPKSLGKLHNLLTLDLKGSLVVEISDEVRGLCNLQYLVAYSVDHDNRYNINTDQGIRINGSVIGSLESLEKLYYADFQSQNGEHFGRELRRLKRLRKLGITKLKSDCGEALCDAIRQMHHLHALRISAVKEDEVLELESLSPPPSLHRIRLHGISDDSLKILGDLPKLLEVWLHEGYNGVELHFEQGRFQKLKFLALRCLYKLEKLVIDRGSLPCLENLLMGPSPLLQEVPNNICNLNSLRTLVFQDMKGIRQKDYASDCQVSFVNGKFRKDPKHLRAEDSFLGINMPGNMSNQLGSVVTPVNDEHVPVLLPTLLAYLGLEFTMHLLD